MVSELQEGLGARGLALEDREALLAGLPEASRRSTASGFFEKPVTIRESMKAACVVRPPMLLVLPFV